MDKTAQGFSVPVMRDRKSYTKYAATKNPQRTKYSKKRPFMGGHYLATILANHMVSGE